MLYGLEVYDHEGNEVLGVIDQITRYVFHDRVSSSGSKTVPEIGGHDSVEFITKTSNDVFHFPYDFYRSGNTYYYGEVDWGFDSLKFGPSATVVFSFLYT